MIIKTWRDPYDAGFSPTKPKEVEFQPGLTVLVGCNGAGKTTLLLNIKEVCKKNKIPCIEYNNLKDGGSNAIGSLFYSGDFGQGAYLMQASEGECIKANVGRKAKTFSEFIENGFVNDRAYKFFKAFSGSEEETITCKDRVFLFDAVDSGLSVDSIIEVKALFYQILDDFKDSDKTIYIIIAANEYELARKADCFDVNAGKYIRFNDYEEYRTFIINSRKKKEARLDNQTKWREKQRQKELKEYVKIVEQQKKRLAELKLKKKAGKYVSSWEEDDAKRMAKDFLRNKARFISEKDVENIETVESL